jgi:hypothetical protein
MLEQRLDTLVFWKHLAKIGSGACVCRDASCILRMVLLIEDMRKHNNEAVLGKSKLVHGLDRCCENRVKPQTSSTV